MADVLFVMRSSGMNYTINSKITESIDADFTVFSEEKLVDRIENGNYRLVVLYLSRLSADEGIVLDKILKFSKKSPFVLAGELEDLKRYHRKTDANVLRYIKTPILLSAYIKEISSVLKKLKNFDAVQNGTYEADEELQELEIVEVEPPKKILVVDDDIVMLRTINNWLQEWFTVSVAKSGAAALQFLAKEKPDLILLDYDMPVCDGLQTLQMIRSEDNLKDIPVFFLTGVDDNSLVKKALELKPQGYILKGKGCDYIVSKIKNYF